MNSPPKIVLETKMAAKIEGNLAVVEVEWKHEPIGWIVNWSVHHPSPTRVEESPPFA
jgi:hypothetical protein